MNISADSIRDRRIAMRSRNSVRRLRLLASVPLTGLETATAAVSYVTLAVCVFGLHVVRGGLMFDDWTLAYDVQSNRRAHGFFGAFDELYSGSTLSGNSQGRPVEAAANLVLYSLFGSHAKLHLAMALLLAALVAFLFYVVLRWLRLERLHAAAIASLVLLFPASDSTVLWVTGSIAHVAIAFYLLGLICALRGLRSGGRAAVGLSALAGVCYAASILAYQIAAPLVLVSVLVYRLSDASWRRSITAWASDVLVAAVSLAYVKAHLPRGRGSLSEDLHHARNIAGEARHLLTTLGVQHGPQRVPTFAFALLLLVAGVAVLVLSRDDPVRRQVRRWLLIVSGGVAATAVAYTIFIPGDFYYRPLAPGIGNRVNAAAALGFAVVLYGSVVLVGLMVTRVLRMRSAATGSGAIGILGAVALTGLFISTINSDRKPYEHAARLQRHALDALRQIGSPAPGTTVYLFGIEGEVSENVYTFVRPNDLTAALRILWHDDTVRGVPVASTRPDWPGNTPANSGIGCGRQGVKPRGWLFDGYAPTPFGEALFVDVSAHTSKRIRSAAGCEAAVALYGPRS